MITGAKWVLFQSMSLLYTDLKKKCSTSKLQRNVRLIYYDFCWNKKKYPFVLVHVYFILNSVVDLQIAVFDLITAHTSISVHSSNSIVFRLQAGICCVYMYLFESHRLVDAIQMSSHNICF